MAVKKAFEIAGNISKTWHDSDFDGKQKLQNLIYPKGIRYNKQNDTVRTEKINSLFGEISILSGILTENGKGSRSTDCLLSSYVPRTGFEPARPFEHHHLKVACLPISTPGLLFQECKYSG
jgi:hypothetical protein